MVMLKMGARLGSVLSRGWWVLLARGAVAMGFGVLCWTQPGVSLGMLVTLFGAFALVDGLLLVWAAFAGREQADDWWVLLLAGLAGIGAAALTFAAPGITALALLFYIAAWAVATGLLHVVAAIRLRREIRGEWLYIAGGLAAVAFGVALMARPAGGALALVWLIGGYALVSGMLLVVMAFRTRGFGRRLAAL